MRYIIIWDSSLSGTWIKPTVLVNAYLGLFANVFILIEKKRMKINISLWLLKYSLVQFWDIEAYIHVLEALRD